jgi:hypothetical protein
VWWKKKNWKSQNYWLDSVFQVCVL